MASLSHDLTFHCLGEMFDVNEQTAANIYYSIVVQLFQHRNNIPVLTLPNGDINRIEVDTMLENIDKNTPVFYKELVKDFKEVFDSIFVF